MEFGVLQLPVRYPWENWSLRYELDLDVVQLAEKLGFDEYYYGEHHTQSFEGSPVPEYQLARASVVTDRIKLGPGVLSVSLHDPLRVAERMSYLDVLTQGRLIFSLGSSSPKEHDFFDLPGGDRHARLEESIDIIETLISADGPVTYDGEFWQYEDIQLKEQPYQESPPIGVAGSQSAFSYELAGRKGYWPMSVYYALLDSDRSDVCGLSDQGEIIDESAKRAGRDPQSVRDDWRILREVYVADTTEQAIEEVREGIRMFYIENLAKRGGLGKGMMRNESMEIDDITVDYLIENVPLLIGSPEHVIEQIKMLQEETGGFGGLILNTQAWGSSSSRVERSLELFARYVMPEFQPEKRSSFAMRDFETRFDNDRVY